MSIKQIVATVFVALGLALVAWKDNWQAVTSLLIVTIVSAAVESSERKDTADNSDALNQIKDLQNKVQGLLLAKGLGR